MSYPIPPNTRAVGNPNPPGDMNDVASILGLLLDTTPGDTLTSAQAIAGAQTALKIIPTITPEQYGAAGNGTTDDTTAVSDAITAAGVGGILFFANTYLISTGVAPLSGQRWYGPGTLLLKAAVTAPIVNATSALSDVYFGEGLIFDGNQANQTTAGNSLVHFTSPTGVVIEGCTFQNSLIGTVSNSTPAIQLRMPQDSKIRECYFYNVGYGPTLGSLNTDSTPMYGNEITGCDINTTGWDGIFLTENLGSVTSITPSGYLHGTVVANCRFRQVGDAAVEVGSGNVGAVVSGCTMDNTAATSVGNNGIIIRDSQDVAVAGVTIRNYLKSSGTGIYLLNLNGTSVNGKNDQNITISGCVIDTVDYGINDGAGVTGLTIAGCIINKFSQTSAGSTGIKLADTSTFTITGTTLANGLGTPGSNEGLDLIGAHDGTVSGCNFFDNRGNDAFIINSASYDITVAGCRFGPSNTGHALRIFDSASHDITITGNDLSGNSTGNGVILPASPGANIVVRGNNAVNPYGAETVSVPATTVPVVPVQHDRTYYVTNGAATSTFALNPTIAVLSSALSTAATITSLPVVALNAAVPSGSVLVSSGGSTQSWTTAGTAQSATAVPVTSQAPNFAYPAGSAVFAGTGLTVTFPASAVVPIRVPANSILIPAYSDAPTWVVEGE